MLSLHQIVVSLCVGCQVMAVVISRSLGIVLPPVSILSVGRELSLVGGRELSLGGRELSLVGESCKNESRLESNKMREQHSINGPAIFLYLVLIQT